MAAAATEARGRMGALRGMLRGAALHEINSRWRDIAPFRHHRGLPDSCLGSILIPPVPAVFAVPVIIHDRVFKIIDHTA